MSITLGELKIQSRDRADMRNSQFIEDAELTNYINNSLAELHDILIGAYNEEYVMEMVEFTSSGGVDNYPLPDGTNYDGAPKFYKLRGVDVRVLENQWQTVHRFNWNERNADQNNVSWALGNYPWIRYRTVGSKVFFSRIPDVNSQFRFWYYPKCVVLVNDSDVYDDVNGYAEYVIVDAAIKMMQKEESDVSVLMAQKQALKVRIQEMAQNRDANEPESVSDIYAENGEYFWRGNK